MPKNVFRSGEFNISEDVVNISPPIDIAEPVGDIDELEDMEEEYTGPTVQELRQEAELFKAQWEEEKSRMESDAHAKAEEIIQKAEATAFEEVRKRTASIQEEKERSAKESSELMKNSRAEAEKILEEAREKVAAIEAEATKKGFEEGQNKGYESGRLEGDRLIDRLHTIINKTIERRNDIIEESEAQLIQLVLQIAKKVIKVISEKQRNVVVSNVIQALRKLKTKANVVVRVNLEDLRITTEHTREFIERFERVDNITVMEDSTVDPGGAIIETEFGQIDARIMSQLREIEDAIIELAPIADTKGLRT